MEDKTISFKLLGKKSLHENIAKIVFDFLMEVQPKHIDEIGIYNKDNKLLMIIFPALASAHTWYIFENHKEILMKSDYLVKIPFNLSEIAKVRAYSEEVDQTKLLEIIKEEK